MNSKRSRKFAIPCLVFFLSISPLVFAQQKIGSKESGQEASPSQAQATLASLFGRGAKMPGIPRIHGTIALPSFDNSKMIVDERTLKASQEKRSE